MTHAGLDESSMLTLIFLSTFWEMWMCYVRIVSRCPLLLCVCFLLCCAAHLYSCGSHAGVISPLLVLEMRDTDRPTQSWPNLSRTGKRCNSWKIILAFGCAKLAPHRMRNCPRCVNYVGMHGGRPLHFQKGYKYKNTIVSKHMLLRHNAARSTKHNGNRDNKK